VELVANDLNVKPSEVLEMESRLGNFDESFDAPADDDDLIVGPSNYLSLGEQEDPAWVASTDESTSLKSQGLVVALGALDERSRDIVEKRWLHDEKMGLKELSQYYGVSMERIRQIEKKAFEKMQDHLLV
jgi:RNA polymerase sigma-32 factor